MNDQHQQPDLSGITGLPGDPDANANEPDDEVPQGLAALTLTPEEVEEAARGLAQLDWGDGLTRVEIRRRFPELPDTIFMRLPSSRQYTSAEEVLRDADLSTERADGEWVGEAENLDEGESLDEGGPPAWGPDPLLSNSGIEQSGSATDTEGLVEGS